MSYPPSYFEHEQKIKTQAQMLETLKARSAARAKLDWASPVKNPDGSGSQSARGTLYVIRKTKSKGEWIYWAWHDRKLLGYDRDVELARNHCEAHYLRSQP